MLDTLDTLNFSSLSEGLHASTQLKCICDLIKLGKYKWQEGSHPFLVHSIYIATIRNYIYLKVCVFLFTFVMCVSVVEAILFNGLIQAKLTFEWNCVLAFSEAKNATKKSWEGFAPFIQDYLGDSSSKTVYFKLQFGHHSRWMKVYISFWLVLLCFFQNMRQIYSISHYCNKQVRVLTTFNSEITVF